MPFRHAFRLLLGVLLVPLPVAAQEVRMTGELRPRYEQRTPDIPSAPAADVMMRARLGVVAALPESISLHVSVQDVVAWGGSAAVAGGSPAPDVFVAFAEIGNLAGSEGAVRLGRQEIALGNQRLISNNNWGHRGNRFDGVRLLVRGGGPQADVFAVRLSESGPEAGTDTWLHGAHTALPLPGGDAVHLYALYNRERGPFDTDQITMGGHTRIDVAGVGWMVEAYLQRGIRRDQDVSAVQFALGATRTLGSMRTQLLYEHYSGGEEEPGRVRAFDRLRGSNHGFHGYADLFTDVPENTAGLGLRDLSLRTTVAAGERTEIQINGHRFRSTDRGALPSSRFGEELDLVVTHRPRAGLALEGGLSHVRAGPGLEEVRGLGRNLIFGYAMVTVSF